MIDSHALEGPARMGARHEQGGGPTDPDRPEGDKVDSLERKNTMPRQADPMTFTPLDDLLAEPDEKVAWVWDGILPAGGLSVIAAKPKAGKSTLARNLAHCVVTGTEFLGRKVTQGPVLYMTFEEKRAEVKRHFRLMGTKGPLHTFTGEVPPAPTLLLQGAIGRVKPVLVIIDTLFKLVAVRNTNDYSEAIAAMQRLLRLARESDAHLFAVHHAGKREQQGGDAILGSTGIFASVDTAIILKRSEKHRTISTHQRYGEDMEETTLRWDPERKMVSLGKGRQEGDLEAMEEAMSRFLKQRGPLTEAEIHDTLGGRKALKVKALRSLVNGGAIERTGRGGRNDPFRYSCSLAPRIYAGTREQEYYYDGNPNDGEGFSCSRDFAWNR